MSAQPALFNDRIPRRKSADCWTPDEVQFALDAMKAWKAAFANVAGGWDVYDTRHNRFVAIQFHRRNCQRPASERFTDDDVAAAIAAYAACPTNVKLQSWKRFSDWFKDAEENIDHQLRRIGRPKGKTDGRHAAATRVVENLGAGRFAKLAAQESMALTEYLRMTAARIGQTKYPRAGDKATRAACLRLLALAARFKALAKDQRENLKERAWRAFTALSGRVPMATAEDVTLCRAIILSLMDYDARRAVQERSASKEPTP